MDNAGGDEDLRHVLSILRRRTFRSILVRRVRRLAKTKVSSLSESCARGLL